MNRKKCKDDVLKGDVLKGDVLKDDVHHKKSSLNVRKLFCVLFSLLFLFSLGCGKKSETPTDTAVPLPTATPSPTPMPAPSAEVVQTVAYYFPDSNGSPALYGGIEFTNTGKVPLVISEAKFTFKTTKKIAEETFEPLVYKSDIIAPGETSNLALWIEYTDAPPEGPITLTAELTPLATDDVVHHLRIANPFIADNYPTFSTISGTIENPAADMDFDLSLVYFSFYDANEKLLGVWHFTKDMAIPSEETRNFVMHMRSLPIPGLGKQTARIVTRAIGI